MLDLSLATTLHVGFAVPTFLRFCLERKKWFGLAWPGSLTSWESRGAVRSEGEGLLACFCVLFPNRVSSFPATALMWSPQSPRVIVGTWPRGHVRQQHGSGTTCALCRPGAARAIRLRSGLAPAPVGASRRPGGKGKGKGRGLGRRRRGEGGAREELAARQLRSGGCTQAVRSGAEQSGRVGS